MDGNVISVSIELVEQVSEERDDGSSVRPLFLREEMATGKYGQDEFELSLLASGRALLLRYRGCEWLINVAAIVPGMLDAILAADRDAEGDPAARA